MKKLIVVFTFLVTALYSQPNWPAIKANAQFVVADTSYATPYIQALNVPGWEDGLFISEDGLNLYSTYLPLDALSWYFAFAQNPACFNFDPYYRPPLLGIDTVTNPWACPNYINSDIIIGQRTNAGLNFNPWTSSNLRSPVTFDGAADGVLLNKDSFDVFVFTKDLGGAQHEDIYFMRNVPVNPNSSTAIPIMSTASQEDNPNIDRVNDSTLVLFFDRDRYIYYSTSTDNGNTWAAPVQVTQVLNDQAPYDVQPNLWFDGTDWWIFFCANDINGIRSIYKSKQQIPGNWDSWGAKQMVIQSGVVNGGYGAVYAVGEPTLTKWGDLSFVAIYGDAASADTTDRYDCDPWLLPKKGSAMHQQVFSDSRSSLLKVFPVPATNDLTVCDEEAGIREVYIYDLRGAEIRHEILSYKKDILKIDISGLPVGSYILKANNKRAKFFKAAE